MFLEYNNVKLQIEHVVSYDQRAVYDPSGVDYLYMHHRIVVEAVWNPEATRSANGEPAAVSIAALRSALMTPRKWLTFGVPDPTIPENLNLVLSSPLEKPGGGLYPCDENNGPKPIGEPIIQIIGQKTAIVQFAVETWVKDCTNLHPILSHRWEMSLHFDRRFFATRTITGTAIFSTQWLNSRTLPAGGARAVYPDDFRRYLFHPIPNNFQRQDIQVAASADGTSLRYTIVDEEQPANITQTYRAITRIEGFYNETTGAASVMPGRGAARGARNGGAFGPFGAAAGAVIGWATEDVVFPKQVLTLTIRVWGRRATSRTSLLNAVARAITSFRFGDQTFLGILRLPSTLFHSTYLGADLFQPYLEATVTAEPTTFGNLLQRAIGIGPSGANLQTLPESLEPVTTRDDGQTSNPTFRSRGTWLAGLVTQSFSTPCEDPPTGRQQKNAMPSE